MATDEDFRGFFAQQYERLCRLGFLLTGDPAQAEELAQDALVRTWRRWRLVHKPDNPEAYARKVLLNRHRSLLRRAMVEARHAPASRPQAQTRHQPDFSGDDLLLWQALRRLPTRQRAAIVLRYYLDLPEAEVARQLGVPVGTVKSLVHRGLARLRDRLGAEYAGERLTSNTEAEA
jgi:RNA polymerase sigma-70 factor (sigma-E family)